MITTPSSFIYGEERVNIPLDEERVNTPQSQATSSQSGHMTKFSYNLSGGPTPFTGHTLT